MSEEEEPIWHLIGAALLVAALLYFVSCGVVAIATWDSAFGNRVAKFTFVVSFIGLGIIFVVAEKMKVAKQRRLREERERDEQEVRDITEQRSYREELEKIPDAALRYFEGFPRKLSAAEDLLDKASTDYSEGAYAPFWQSIEQAAYLLGSYNDDVVQTSILARRHAELKPRYRGRSEPFPLSAPSAKATAIADASVQRLNHLVRTAQRSFEFSMIYEQRKTNQLLVAGFTTLAGALEGMGQRLSSSIGELTAAVESSSAGLRDSMDAVAQATQDQGARLDGAVRGGFGALAQRHDRALEMLDNIQRRRVPRPRGLRDGEY
ncbi:MAG: hypothetical protein K8E66_00450 [Phycisphaerales bacterium]|nr:hypothetical protein [Phycisphaerales bacterium]